MLSMWAKGCVAACTAVVLVLSGGALAQGVPGQGTWETTLEPRDLDGNGEPDAYYDRVLNVTWLRNANAGGILFWDEAMAWARNLRHGGYSDWRLPTLVDTGESGCDWAYGGTDCGYNVQTKGARRTFSEMEHLMRITLGNTPYCDTTGRCGQPGWGLSNTGPFQNLYSYFYWTGTSYPGVGLFGWYYYTPSIYQSYGVKTLGMHAMALRSGDSVPQGLPPEPPSPPVMPVTARVPGQGTWETTLLPRDLDGDGKTDAFYDTVLDLTWLRDLGTGGLQFWGDANAWVRTLRAGGYSDWRLPLVVDTFKPGCNFGYSGTDCGYNVRALGPQRPLSELAHLLTTTLGNKGYCDTAGQCDQAGWRTVNVGDFQNMQSIFIWTSVEYTPNPSLAWYFYPYLGYQSFGHKNHLLQVLPVRQGDSGVPSTR